MAPVTAVQLFNVFPVTVLVGAVPPSVKFNPVIVEVPATVMLEKLLFVQFETQPVTEDPLSVTNITEPDAPALLNAVTIELFVTVLVAVADAVYVSEIKVAVPVVLILRFVKVFPLINEVRTAAVL